MNIRHMVFSDVPKLKEIHRRHYQEEFEFPEFFDSHCLCAFIIETDGGEVISGGGVKTIAESIILTDKDMSPRVRKDALLNVLQASQFLVSKFGYDRLHAFIQDEKWMNHLKKVGFEPTRGTALIY